MNLRKLLLACGASLALAGIASAQSSMPSQMPPGYRALPPFRIAAIVRASGFDPLFRPMRQGDTYVLRALDRNDLEYRLVIDAYTGRTMSAHATGARGAPGYGPHGGPVYGRIFNPRDERFDTGYGYGPPHPRPPQVRAPQAGNATQVPAAAPSKPTQLATPEPSKTTEPPMPRPRPYVMEATSSIPVDPPKAAEPQKAPPPPPAPQNPVPDNPAPAAPADTPQSNGGASMPPVTPLD